MYEEILKSTELKKFNEGYSFKVHKDFSMERDFLKFNSQNEIHMYDHTINNNYFLT